MSFEEGPAFSVGGGPVFSEEAAADGALVLEFAQTFLDSDADVATDAGGTVAVDQLDDTTALLAGQH